MFKDFVYIILQEINKMFHICVHSSIYTVQDDFPSILSDFTFQLCIHSNSNYWNC